MQVNGTLDHTQLHLATSGECLLSSRSRVRIPLGRTVKPKREPEATLESLTIELCHDHDRREPCQGAGLSGGVPVPLPDGEAAFSGSKGDPLGG